MGFCQLARDVGLALLVHTQQGVVDLALELLPAFAQALFDGCAVGVVGGCGHDLPSVGWVSQVIPSSGER